MSAQPAVAAKTERLLNLVIALLSTRMPLSKQRIRTAVPQYQQTASDEAFDRMFERDKDELRELGIPLVTEAVDPTFDDETGYRIDHREYDLPAIAFEPDEVAALALAGRTWTHATLAAPAAAALVKLESAGVALDDTSLVGIEPRVRTTESAFEPLRKAVLARQPVSFDYRKAGSDQGRRRVEPWGLAMWRGRWYLTAHDQDRDAQRVFRLSRIVGPVTTTARAGSYDVPAEHEPRVVVESSEPAHLPRLVATLRVREGAGNTLRRRALSQAELAPGWSVVTVEYAVTDRLAAEVAGFGPDVVVESPDAVREAVVRRLSAVRDRHTGRPGVPR
ncbi:MAG: helix-turn-helix transcriptional regulator [Dermatophilaceae bacterium]